MANAADELLKVIEADTSLPEELRNRAKAARGESATEAFKGDIWIYRVVVVVLGTTVLATVFGGLALAGVGSTNYKLPAEIVAIGSAAVGALAGLFAPSPASGK